MAFDQPTRTRLQNFVSDARNLLVQEFTRQLQNDYGMDPSSGSITPIESLSDDLPDAHRETARILRETFAHYAATAPSGENIDALDRIIREQAFTVLNRLAALRMAEARELLIESISQRYNSKGFQLYSRLVGPGFGETGDAYRAYLFGIFDEFAVDLAVLFDRFSPQGLLFPREPALLEILRLINDPEISALWAEDETIGWIYQYFNSKEERKKMRDESAAPRNSRELAVRNQFFTPRYVVEFLTDNTLGRIWYEMRQGETRLKEQCRYLVRRPTEIFLQAGEEVPESSSQGNLSQEELLRQPVHVLHRALKDPRDIRMLDPACGSMHFGLYAFDLFETIYGEAWEVAHETTDSQTAPSAFASFVSFALHYADKNAFLEVVPRLILQHNLHGIDIDARAMQIAGFSLWLRAQRSWQQQGLRPQDRLQIRRSNIVCAESMPGEQTFLDEFIEGNVAPTSDRRLLGQLVRRVFDAMKFASEAGSLLQIEQEISAAVAEAKQEWLAAPKFEQRRLFADDVTVQKQLRFDVLSITDDIFWEQVEERIYASLKAYAEYSEKGRSYQRRLFADDVVRGFAFIDICRKRYDVVLMNPPFGDATPTSAALVKKQYPDYAENLYVAFHTRASQVAVRGGLVGTISSRTFLAYRDFESLRLRLLDSTIRAFADLGWEVLDGAQVETAAYITEMNPPLDTVVGPFFRLLSTPVDRKDLILADAVRFRAGNLTFFTTADRIKKLPGAPLCYWSSRQFVEAISTSSKLHPLWAYVGRGASPHAFYFRAWWEVPSDGVGIRWKRICRGGDYSPFYRSNALVIDWLEDGSCVKEYILKKYPYLNGNYGWAIQDEDKYGVAGITWGKRNERFNAQAMPAEHIFTDEGQGIVPTQSVEADFLLGYLNSSLVAYFLSLTSGLQKHWVYIRPIPVLDLSLESKDRIRAAARTIIGIKQYWNSTSEISGLYVCAFPALIPGETSLRNLTKEYLQQRSDDSAKIADLRYQINNCVFSHTPLGSDDITEIQALLAGFPKDVPNTDGLFSSATEPSIDVAEGIVSFCLGVCFGRWDLRFATGSKPVPDPPDPFSALPICPPGQFKSEHGLPITKEDAETQKKQGIWDYPIEIPWDGILVDDQSNPLDMERRVQYVLQVIWKERWESIEREVCEFLGVNTLREYFRKGSGFFADHLKRYSKSRRQAPIYWPLSTPRGGYTLYIYYVRVNSQTLYTCINEFVEPKLRDTKSMLNTLRTTGTQRSSKDEEELERLFELELELQELRDELQRLATLPWTPNLNDGVQITAAPLWKLFRLPTWQKTLKETWMKLEKGEYDWAHLAYSLWPDRIREKCKADKSLAIAHGLEELYERPTPTSKKKRARKAPVQMVEEE